MSSFRPCVIIPVYNHWLHLEKTVSSLRASGLPVLLINDGSNSEVSKFLQSLSSKVDGLTLYERSCNGGKGAAIKDGLFLAETMGFSHAVQVDADGQHDLHDLPDFLASAQTTPEALVCGYPQYDESVPAHRYYGRYLTHVWIWINTLSTRIKDSLCGYRVYPVSRSAAICRHYHIGERMDFDAEFLVRWDWLSLPLVQLPTKVIYPEDGTSQFRLLQDNALISRMHAKLFFLMLPRVPWLLRRRWHADG